MPRSRFFNVANMSFNAIRENIILVNSSIGTVCIVCVKRKYQFKP